MNITEGLILSLVLCLLWTVIIDLLPISDDIKLIIGFVGAVIIGYVSASKVDLN